MAEDYDTLTKILADVGSEGRWNQDPETILNAMTKIAHHETGGTLDPTQKQFSGGPGRGLYQYETGEGKGAHTAMNRLYNYYGQDIPEWASQVNKENLWDVSSLTPEQQSILFLADKSYDKTANMRDITEEGGVQDFWLKEHWAGQEYDEQGNLTNQEIINKRLDSFNKSMGSYKDTLLDQLLPKVSENVSEKESILNKEN
jgi:hypothetical protein